MADEDVARIVEFGGRKGPGSRCLPRGRLWLGVRFLRGEPGNAVEELLAGLAVGPSQHVGVLLQA